MGVWERVEKAQKSVERPVIVSQTESGFENLVERSRKQAERALQDFYLIETLKSGDYIDSISSIEDPSEREEIASEIVSSYPELLPDHIEDDVEQRAFIVAVCLQLSERGSSKMH